MAAQSWFLVRKGSEGVTVIIATDTYSDRVTQKVVFVGVHSI
jgi:hypothetical protein